MYDKLVNKVNTIDSTEFVLKTQYNTGKSGLEKKIDDTDKKISHTRGLVKKQIMMPRSLRVKLKFLVLQA